MPRRILLLIGLLLGCGIGGLFCYELPELPSKREGDDKQVTTTVGHMRQALWWRAQAEILVDYATELEGINTDYQEESLRIYNENLKLNEYIQAQNETIAKQDKNKRGLQIGLAVGIPSTLIVGLLGGILVCNLIEQSSPIVVGAR